MRNLVGAVILISLLVALFGVGQHALPALELALQPELQPAATATPAPPPRAVAKNPLRVLFVGNSHTYFNDMPSMVVQLAAAAKEKRGLEISLEVEPGAGLLQHLANRKVHARLSQQRWDYVVLQDQQQRPSFTFDPKEVERQFFAPARTLDVLIRAASAKTVLFMTAARRPGDPELVPGDDYEHMQERTRQSYTRLAHELGATLAPVGVAWRWAHEKRPDLPLWAADGYHPGQYGSYLAACVFYRVLYDHSALDNPYTAGLPAADANLLQQAADVASFL
jgi:hypothetical protein